MRNWSERENSAASERLAEATTNSGGAGEEWAAKYRGWLDKGPRLIPR